MSFELLKRPSGYLPVMMSLGALALVVGHVVIYPLVCEADEGTPAHIYQLLMGLQVLVIGYFVVRWLPTKPRQAVPVLALQALAAFCAFAALFIMESLACHK